jgi:hypothetical protein
MCVGGGDRSDYISAATMRAAKPDRQAETRVTVTNQPLLHTSILRVENTFFLGTTDRRLLVKIALS